MRRRGLWVAFLGPDGAGKSTLLQLLAAQPPAWCEDAVVRHLKPSLFKRASQPTTDPHGEPPRGLPMSLAKGLYWLVEYTLGYRLRVRPDLEAGKLVLFDRYLLDTLVDPRRYRYGGPDWLLRLLWRAVPKPDLIVLLDAPVGVLLSRKEEVASEEVARQRQAYRELIRQQPRGFIVDASGTAEMVLATVSRLLDAATGQRIPDREQADG